jgi:hypothetical protein
LHQPIHSLLPAFVYNMPTPSDNPEELEKEVPDQSDPCFMLHFLFNVASQVKPLDDEDIELLKTYGVGPYR